jgi:TrmH family RNA methyltransferase
VTSVAASEALSWLASHGFALRGAVAHGGTPHTDVDWSRRSALVLGNEAKGLDESLRPKLDELVTVSMSGHAESLNVSIAGAVICFEALRQRSSTLAGVQGRAGARHDDVLNK